MKMLRWIPTGILLYFIWTGNEIAIKIAITLNVLGLACIQLLRERGKL